MTNVILFRAQPFHLGHVYMIRQAVFDGASNGNEVYVFVGSADKSGTKRNPLPIELRLALVKGSLYNLLTDYDRKHVHVYALNDQTDESHNTHEWGKYLYENIKEVTGDEFMTLYYVDEPSIPLSWFGPEERKFVSFKFLSRYDDISATNVREAIKNDDLERLRYMVPDYVYAHREEIKRYLK